MRRSSLLALVCFAGCTMPGTRPKPMISQTAPQAPPSQVAEAPSTTVESRDAGFSFSRLFQMASFFKPETSAQSSSGQYPSGQYPSGQYPSAPSLVPQEVVHLGNVINAVTAKSAELNVNDPPEVTQQKAQAILESLQGWDSTLAASTSTGLVNSQIAQTLNAWVVRLRGEAQKLVQYMPNPQTIAAVQQLAGSLTSTFGNLSAMLNQGNAASQALLGASRG